MALNLQTALQLIYPPQCLICRSLVESDFGLCGPCWRDTPFVGGLCCDKCGVPLPGDDAGQVEHCDDCLNYARPWLHGRAAMTYRDNGRKLVLALKHGDRHDIVHPAALWMAQAAKGIIGENSLFVPVPLHWTRMIRRKYNQSALLAHAVAKVLGKKDCPDLLVRQRRTRPLQGMGHTARFETLDAAITIHAKRRRQIVGQPIVLVDDVMTSGATLAACADACLRGGARTVPVLILARVAKDA